MKKYFKIFTLFIATMFFAFNANAQFSGGNGTQATPYLISTKANLIALSDSVNKGWATQGKYFKQIADIVFNNTTDIKFDLDGTLGSESNFVPIGSIDNRFKGNYNGGEHIIDGIIIKSNQERVGLFGYCDGANISNLGILDCDISGNIAGGLVGHSYNTSITNCFVTGNVSGGAFAGLLIGFNGAGENVNIKINNCYTIGTLTGNSVIGGLIAQSGVANKNKPTISITNSYTASSKGLIGTNNYCVISNCYYLNIAVASDGGTAKASAEMQSPTFVSTLNNGQNPEPYKYDANKINKGYPILSWQTGGTSNPNITDGLVAYYPFNGNANDESGNNNHGTINGGVTLTTDRFGNPNSAYNFGGFSGKGYIKVLNSSSLQFSDQITISLWVNLNGFGGMDNLYGGYATDGVHYLISKGNDHNGGLLFMIWKQICNWAFGGSLTNASCDFTQLNQWIHLTAIINNNRMQIFRDGIKLTDVNNAHKWDFTSANLYNLYIGCMASKDNSGTTWGSSGSLWYPFNGAIDDIRIYNRALTETEIKALYDGITPPPPDKYVVTASVYPENSGTITGDGEYAAGKLCILTATANQGYKFVNWEDKETGFKFVLEEWHLVVDRNYNLVANFEKEDTPSETFTISIATFDQARGTVTGGGKYEDGQLCTLTATAKQGYKFVKWTETGKPDIMDNPYSFKVTGDRTLAAVFEKDIPHSDLDIQIKLSGAKNEYTKNNPVIGVCADGSAKIQVVITGKDINKLPIGTIITISNNNSTNYPSGNIGIKDGNTAKYWQKVNDIEYKLIKQPAISVLPLIFDYQAPEVYTTKDNDKTDSRTITIEMTADGQHIAEKGISIARPPVLLLHGVHEGRNSEPNNYLAMNRALTNSGKYLINHTKDYYLTDGTILNYNGKWWETIDRVDYMFLVAGGGNIDENKRVYFDHTYSPQIWIGDYRSDAKFAFFEDLKVTGNNEEFYALDWYIDKKHHAMYLNIDTLKSQMASVGYVSQEVDAVGFSMGGLIIRSYIQSNTYRNDVNRIITLNTPHSGSQSAQYIYEWFNTGSLFWNGGGAVGLAISNTLVKNRHYDDEATMGLWVQSESIKKINNSKTLSQSQIPCHTIYSTALTADIDFEKQRYGAKAAAGLAQQAAKLHNMFYAPVKNADYLFNDVSDGPSDFVVAQLSQQGGLTGKATTFVPKEWHGGMTCNPTTISEVQSLLEKLTTSEYFAKQFNPPSLKFDVEGKTKPKIIIVDDFQAETDSVYFTQPADAMLTVYAGDKIHIKASATKNIYSLVCFVDFSKYDVFFIDTSKTSSTNNLTLDFDLTIPNNILGSAVIYLMGSDTLGNLYTDSVQLLINTKAKPVKLLFTYPLEDKLILFEGKNAGVKVACLFDDSSSVDITTMQYSGIPALFCSFTSGNAEYMGDGVIQGKKVGTDTLVVSVNPLAAILFSQLPAEAKLPIVVYENTDELKLGEVNDLELLYTDTMSAIFKANLVSMGNANLNEIEMGFVYSAESQTAEPIYEHNEKVLIDPQYGEFYGEITGLDKYKKYCVRAFIKNEIGISYSNTICFDAVVSIEENANSFDFMLYPNATSDKVMFIATGIAGESIIEISDLAGSVLHSFIINASDNIFETTIDLTGYPSGAYIVRLQNNKQIAIKKVIKN